MQKDAKKSIKDLKGQAMPKDQQKSIKGGSDTKDQTDDFIIMDDVIDV